MWAQWINQAGRRAQAWLSEFLELPYGIQSRDTFGQVFALLDPAGRPHQAFLSWMNALATLCGGHCADGTTIRRS